MKLNAFAYIRSLRNASKKAYAQAYLRELQGGPEADRGALSYMGAQAVRIQLSQIMENHREKQRAALQDYSATSCFINSDLISR